MKKIIKSLALMAVAVTALVSCHKEIEKPNQEPEINQFVYTFTLGDPETKAVLAGDADGYFAKWESTDQLGVYTLSREGITDNTPADIDVTKDPVEFKIVSQYPLAEGSNIYAYFPYDSKNTEVAGGDPSDVVLSIPSAQNGSLSAMPMVAEPYDVTQPISVGTEPIADIKMRNLASVLNFNVYSTNEAFRTETVKSIKFSSNGICGDFTYDITKEAVTVISGLMGTDVTVTKDITPGADKASGSTVPMVVAPNATAGYTGTIVVTTDVAAYTYTLSNALKVARSEIRRVNVNLATAKERKAVKNVQFSVNGVIIDAMTQNLAQGASVDFTAPDASLIPEGMEFMGWYNYGYRSQDTAPEYITEAVVENTDLVYYAVFATKTPGSAASVVFDLQSIDNLSTSNAERTQTAGDITFTFSSVADANVSGTHYVQMAKNSTLTHDTAFAGPIKSITFEGFSYSSTSNASMLVEGKTGVEGTYSTVQSCNGSYAGAEISFGSNDYDFFKITVGSDRTVKFTKMTVSYGTEEYYSDFCTTVKPVASIAVQTPPTKVDYNEDETLDIAGLTLKVTYEDESSEIINSGFTTTPASGAVLTDETSVTVLYREKSCTFDINVGQAPRYDIIACAVEGGSYTVKIGDAEAVIVPAEGATYPSRAAKVVTMTTTANEHYKVGSTPFVVTDADGASVSVSKSGDNYSFTMPAKAVTIKANYSRTYTITAGASTNGSITKIADKDDKEITETSKGSKVVVTATPDEHYHVASMYYVKEGEESHNVISENAGVYSFTMPQSNVTVFATFEENDKYTATFMVNGTSAQSDSYFAGATIAFPSDPDDISDHKFQGWVSTEIDNPTDTKPEFVNTTSQTIGTENVTFYAVFAKVVEGTTSYKLVSSLTNGRNYIFVTRNTAGSGYALSSSVTTGTSVTIVESGTDKVVSGTPAKTIIWAAATGWSLTNTGVDSNNKLAINGSTFAINSTGSSNLSWTSNYGLNGQSGSGSTKYYVQCTNGTFSKSSTSGSTTNRVYAYEEISTGSITGYCTTVEAAPVLQSIAISGSLSQTEYTAGQSLNTAGLTVTATYDKGTPKDVTSQVLWTFDPATLTAGTTSCTATASYGGEHASITVDGLTVNAPVTLELVTVSGEPKKKEYNAGDTFDPAGLTVTGTYSDRHQEPITEGITWSESAALTAGQTSVLITATVNSITSDEYEVTGLTVSDVGPVAGTVLYHETFGDNSGSARDWVNTYSVKSGLETVYSGITGYTVSNAKQGKNTTGSTGSGLNQSSQGTDAYIIVGPLKVDNCTNMQVTYQWKAASTKGTYTTKLYYATSSTGSYTEVTGGTGTGATTFVERKYSLPAAAQVATLYLKVVWNTSNTQAIIDELELKIKD